MMMFPWENCEYYHIFENMRITHTEYAESALRDGRWRVLKFADICRLLIILWGEKLKCLPFTYYQI